MSSPSKVKGSRVEREVVARLIESGIDAVKVPLSGALGGCWSGDVFLQTHAGQMVAEVKARRNGEGFATLERWLANCQLLILKRDRQSPFVAMPWETFVTLAHR